MKPTSITWTTLGLFALLPAWTAARFARDHDLGKRRIAPSNADHWIEKRSTLFSPLAYAAGQISFALPIHHVAWSTMPAHTDCQRADASLDAHAQ